MTPDAPPPITFRSWSPEDTPQLAAVLGSSGLKECADPGRWRWKHEHLPAFLPDNVLIMAVADRVVGCAHTTPLQVRLQGREQVLASFDGEFAVLPEMRGSGLMREGHHVTQVRLRDRHVALRGGFTSEQLHQRFYRASFGYTRIALATRAYQRFLRPAIVQARVERLRARWDEVPLSTRRRLEGLSIEVALRGMPPFAVLVGSGGPRLRVAPDRPTGIRVEGPAALLHLFASGDFRLRHLARTLLRGRIRIRRWWRHPLGLLTLTALLIRGEGP